MEFLEWKEINVSIIHVYQLCLMEKYADYFEQSLVAFLCLAKLTLEVAHRKPTMCRDFIRDAFLMEMRKNDKQCKLILLSYNVEFHWMLLVIDLRGSEVVVFNSVKNANLKELKIYPFLIRSLKFIRLEGIGIEKQHPGNSDGPKSSVPNKRVAKNAGTM